ncbi:GDP-mannose pyrophosphorylase [Trypanosoma cruzi]|uniref:mannose-1-phosphate guanylyltransferase n=2 Tax=Trypanosoma cruzi TaxID=5693 RepID=Q4CMK4_TRYCC|nr:mannose-1-phosphate guanyltransferase, putative [Trypanosoma cruzi]EAN81505.1 mannose-1-phosphate guanyltransferase, putative [Trypanosoma cruzi]KAF5217570.1 GDP-mannose pyrophosphorylase [Trypanosoma cruzi]PWU93887.1 GDP-mannose pyrophosphorylase [Trypanosoma cruzi]RNC53407.1 GDP-mannose pyrophosphorylase [Trypanosoma cruzi]|eukprot:XP_802951.1 mannose-1-phosphate guanyltransferase [Trypanosoma cruzi strain CL Brener]
MSEEKKSVANSKGMRAVILVGGYGTRLRPLTLTMPKPLVPFCNKPIIVHQVEALRDAGVTEVILAVAYRSDAMRKNMDYWSKELGVSFVFSLEEEPLGTAGPLALARDILLQDDQPFFVLNADITCRFPLRELLSFHQKSGKEGTIAVTKVTDWQKYGVVVFDEATGVIDQFVEKPKNFVGDRINAGIYVFNKSVLNRIKVEKTSIETQVFPQMASAKQLCAFILEGFWMDIGVPKDYIEGVGKYLRSLNGTPKESQEVYGFGQAHKTDDFTVIGSVIIDPSAKIGKGCVIGPFATIGPGCVIGPTSRIRNSAILDESTIGKGTLVDSSIIGWKSRVGSWCRVVNNTVLGEDVEVKDELFLNGIKVLPNKSILQSYHEPEVVM